MQFLIGSLFGTKCDLLDLLLNKGKVMVHLDARREGVDVPARFKGDHHLRLKLSLWFGIDDFVYDDDGVRASLSFGGTRFYCVLPWSAIFAMTSHVEPVGYLWPEDLPTELASQLTPSTGPGQTSATDAQRPRAGGLRVVEGGKDTHTASQPPGERDGDLERATSDDNSAALSSRELDEADAVHEQRGGSSDADDNEMQPGDGPEPGRRYGHLRVVK